MARPNVRVMFEYVKSKRHLMLVMNLLRSSSRSIQHEAFHVFKVFVANPRKPDDIKSILVSNRDKLLRFLTAFLEERGAAPPPLRTCCPPPPPPVHLSAVHAIRDCGGLVSPFDAGSADGGAVSVGGGFVLAVCRLLWMQLPS